MGKAASLCWLMTLDQVQKTPMQNSSRISFEAETLFAYSTSRSFALSNDS